MMPPEGNGPDLGAIIARLSAGLLALDPGPLARLRRMAVDGPGEADFWALAQQCGFLDQVGTRDAWPRLVKIMAMLTPRGEPSRRGTLHDPRRPFGAGLCDGGDRSWPPRGQPPRPVLSETRLARLLSLPAEKRGEALERVARMLASSRDPGSGVNCTDIACLLFRNSTKDTRRLAQTYYSRLDAVRAGPQEDAAA